MKPKPPSIKKPPKPKIQVAPVPAKKVAPIKGNSFSVKLDPVAKPPAKKKRFGL